MNKKKRGRMRAELSEAEKQQRREKFKNYRKKMGLTQKELSPFVSIRGNNIATIETGGARGTAPTNQNLAAIRNLSFIHSHGLLGELLEEINKKR